MNIFIAQYEQIQLLYWIISINQSLIVVLSEPEEKN